MDAYLCPQRLNPACRMVSLSGAMQSCIACISHSLLSQRRLRIRLVHSQNSFMTRRVFPARHRPGTHAWHPCMLGQYQVWPELGPLLYLGSQTLTGVYSTLLLNSVCYGASAPVYGAPALALIILRLGRSNGSWNGSLRT